MFNQHTGEEAKQLLRPFTLLRDAADLRTGIFTPNERYKRVPGLSPELIAGIPANVIVSITGLKEMIKQGITSLTEEHYRILMHAADMAKYNDWAMRQDFEWIRTHVKSAPAPESVTIINPENVFIEPGARLNYCIINATTGPVYIAKDAEIMEGCLLRGPVAVCSGAVVKMVAKIYGATTIGPYCMAGGEIKNSVLMGYSNKAHDGYLGDAVLGEWCNLGAGTSNSNLKNTAGEIMVYNGGEPYAAGIKCGLIMGDYSRSAINTSFNTGTVTGVSCNVFGSGLTPANIPDFSWGLSGNRYREEEAIRDAKNWMALKGRTMSEATEKALRRLYIETLNK